VSTPVALRLLPLEIGDVLDEIFRTYRRHFLLLAGISVAFSVPLAALAGYGFFALFGNLISQAGTGTPANFNALGRDWSPSASASSSIWRSSRCCTGQSPTLCANRRSAVR
jgi:hypothetical protein